MNDRSASLLGEQLKHLALRKCHSLPSAGWFQGLQTARHTDSCALSDCNGRKGSSDRHGATFNTQDKHE